MVYQEQLRDLTESYLKALISGVSESLDPNFDSFAPFGELGVNSFYVLKIIKKLEADFGTLPKSLLFENFNINDLADYFLENHENTLAERFSKALRDTDQPPDANRGTVVDAPAAAKIAAPAPVVPKPVVPKQPASKQVASNPVIPESKSVPRAPMPIRTTEAKAYADPQLREVVETLFARYKVEGCVSRGTRKIAPNLFIGSEKKGYFNYARNKDILLVYGYTGPRDHLPALTQEIHLHCVAKQLQLNILCDEAIPPVCGVSYSATPFGVLQRIRNLSGFGLEGGAMRRLRYQVSKFQKSGAARTVEYRCGTDAETDRSIVAIIERWCAPKTMVNPLIDDVKAEILAGTLGAEHRLFLTYLDDVLQNTILITGMSGEEKGYLMDLEFYPPDMPLGGLEFAIVQMIEALVSEGCEVLSLGGTYGCKLGACADADADIDRILDELREQNIFNDEGNLQFKNKFRPENGSIFLCRPIGSGNPENVIDIIMMIADPLKAQTPEDDDTEGFSTASASLATEATAVHVEASVDGAGMLVIEGNPRSPVLLESGFNPLNIAHGHIEFDLKTDSWAQLEMPSIEAQMKHLHSQLQQPVDVDDSLRGVFPFAHFVLTDSGQSAENIFFRAWPKKGLVLQNLLFPSTIFHQIDKGFAPREMPHPDVFDLESGERYKGDLSMESLEKELARDPEAISFVCVEVSDNAVGGCPVSMQHLKRLKTLLAGFSIPLVIDATRVVENARFLIEQEQEYADKSVWTVVREILSCADVVIGSLTKDFCVKHGGIVATNDPKLFRSLQALVQSEGGGVDLIDAKMIALSLQNRKRIETKVARRMEEVRQLWQALRDRDVPVANPVGAHCVLIDVKRIPEFNGFEHPVASFLAWLYLNTGIRAGGHSVGMQKKTAINDMVRLAIPVGMQQGEVDELISRLVRMFDERVDIPELVLEGGGAQSFGDVYARYRVAAYHRLAGNLVEQRSVVEDAVAVEAVEAAKTSVASAVHVEAANKDAPNTPVSVDRTSDRVDANRIVVTRQPGKSQDIAIIGMAGRYPKAKNLRELWDNLANGRDCIEDIPADRFERRLQHENVAKYRGGFIDDVDKFDSLFFNISPREAEMLDPQERIFLEVAWEAIEDAGYYPEILAQEDASRHIGVFVGAVWAMYQMLGVEERHAGNKIAPNSFLWSIANRVSYWMNLSGPSLTLDTACSSSLTAMYLACEAIQSGECPAAIVGGVNLDLHQTKYDINFNGGALSSDGLCRSFGKGANGYVAGEGVGAIFLKSMERAVLDGDNIYGVIKSAVVNHGGRTSGYTVPNPKAHTSLISAALEKAGIDARTIGYIEAHGTGTELGDPIEITGLANAFKAHRVEHQACAIGSVKSNIGHLEAAAGVVSISKVLLQMKHRRLVPSLHSSELNEFIDFSTSPFRVQQTLDEWSAKVVDGVRMPLRAGISSFGAGGSNAHIILESYEHPHREQASTDEPADLIFPISARNEDQLREVAARLAAFVSRNADDLQDIAHTLQLGRKSFDCRVAIVAQSRDQLLEKLACFIEGKKNEDISVGHVKGADGVTRLLNRREKEEFVRMLSQRRDPRKVAELWAEGLLSDWQGYQSESIGRKISLPTYPFAGKRHWVGGNSAPRRVVQQAAGMHPLVDSNESTFERQIFKKTFHDRDFFIYDHLVADIPTLPGVAYLELARKAGEIAAGRKVQKIKNILWVSPIAIQNSMPKDVFIELKPSGDSVQFEVFSSDANGAKTLHSQGKLSYETKQDAAAEAEYIDIQAIRARCAKVIDGETAYPLFRSLGLNLGPSFQVLQEVYKNDDETFGVLKLPEFRLEDLQSMLLHPSLVDGSLQAGMGGQLGDKAGEMFVPFSIGEVEILHPLQANCFSYVTEAKGNKKEGSQVLRTNVSIIDETGKILVKIRESTGVPLRDVHKKTPGDADADGFSKLFYAYDWEQATLPVEDAVPRAPVPIVLFDTDETLRDLYEQRAQAAGVERAVVLVRPGGSFEALNERSYLIDPNSREDHSRLFKTLLANGIPVDNVCFGWSSRHSDASSDATLKADLQHGVYAFLSVAQAIIEHKLEAVSQLFYLYRGAHGEIQPQHEAVGGFLKALSLESPKFLSKTLEIRSEDGDTAAVLDALIPELGARTPDAVAVRYEAGVRYSRKQKIFDHQAMLDSPAQPSFGLREHGVYLITGGAGGLGLLFAEFLAKEYNARLILTGRSAATAELEAKFDAIRKAGAELEYVPADVSSAEGVAALIETARARFGGINGIIHAAGVIRDAFVRNKTAAELDAVFAPKVFGTLYLDAATKDEPLDFFATFSSLAGMAGNAGQSDYSFANHFMDSFAHRREAQRMAGERSGKSLSINWSLWADGGMKLDEQTELYFRKTLGIKPLSAAVGIEAFAKGLVSDRSQFAVLEGVQDKIELAWGLRKKAPAPATAKAVASTESQSSAASGSANSQGDLVAWLQGGLSQIAMDFLKLDAADVSPDEILLDLGFDSIGLTTYANAINDKYQLDITPVLFFDYPSIGEIAKNLAVDRESDLRKLFGGSNVPAADASAQAGSQTVVADVRAEASEENSFEFKKGWNPAALDRETATHTLFVDASPQLRFVNKPVAIVGMSGIMPQSEDLEAFWENLKNSKDMISVIPADRWRWEDYDGDPLKESNKSNSRWGGFMDSVDKFDPLFFGISPREAQMMDPQQRIFLETVWKAVEDSGQKVSDLSGTRTGLFVGVATNDYIDLMSGQGVSLDGYSASGNSHSVLANRVSFLLNLRGPSAPIDTACSSSLVALHRAVESIHTESCDMAIVGGVQVMLSPAAYISFSMAGMLSPDGRCKSFDKRANGYVRGEGSGAIFIKSLAAAEADGNHVYAVIKATAENHGGRVTTLTAPNSSAQAELLVEAYDKAQIDPTTVGYIECHGTGTSLGDPIEIQALTRGFAELYKKRGKPAAETPHCGLSSVKTNIGHLETAAGIAGLLKVLLAIKHKHIPANLHFEEVNPYINLKGTPFFIADKLTPWATGIGENGMPLPRRAGVSSFGFGGANAHIVLEEYLPAARPSSTQAQGPHLIVLSAKNDDRLKAYAKAMHAHLQKHQDVDLADFVYTLQVGRDEMPERLAMVVADKDQLIRKFAAFIEDGAAPEGACTGNTRSEQAKALVANDAAIQAMIGGRELAKLAEQWASGAKIDWRQLYGAGLPKRISVPTYPFARDRYWMPGAEAGASGARTHRVAAEALHPLIHRNISTLEEQKFASAFTGDEFYFADHKVETQKILPGVAYMEMARAAGEFSGNAKVRVIRNLTWERPIIIGEGSSEIEISLMPAKNEVKFTVRSAGKNEPVTHCSGRLGYVADARMPERLDIAAIQQRCSELVVSGKDLYAFLSGSGLNLGSSFQIVQSIHATEFESLSILQLPEHLKQEAGAFWLHPALMDGSLHTAIGLMKQNGMDIPMSVPYSVSEVQILHPLDDLYYGYATWAVDHPKGKQAALKVNFHLLDKTGKVLVRMKDFVSMPYLQGANKTAPQTSLDALHNDPAQCGIEPGLQTLVPVWNAVRPDPAKGISVPDSSRILLLGGDAAAIEWLRASYPEAMHETLAPGAGIDEIAMKLAGREFDQLVWIAPDATDGVDGRGADDAGIVAQQEAGVMTVFGIAKALLASGYANKSLQWTLIVSRTQRVMSHEPVQAAHAGVAGFVGSLAKECMQWNLRLLDLDSLAAVSARECMTMAWSSQGDAVMRRNGEWFQQALAHAGELPAVKPVYRNNGVYVVVGGAGGVGEVWSRFMIEHYQAKIVWIGRKALNPAIEAKIDALSKLGPSPLYISADATSADALDLARTTILETYPAIHGVVHSAIVLQDQSIARMDEAAFRASLSAKVDICANMDRVFGGDALDFAIYFSSIVSFVKSAGQSNYAAGCTFKDSFAQMLRDKRDYPVKTINWGYWGSVGIVADETYNKLMAQMGIGSIEPEEGMASLHAFVDSDVPQIGLFKTLTAEATASLGLSQTLQHYPATLPAILPEVQGPLMERISGESIADLEAQLPTEALNDLVTEILASSLVSLGVFEGGLRAISELSEGKQPAAYYQRWLDSSIDHLQRQGLFADYLSFSREIRSLEDLWREWDANRSAWATNPNLSAQLVLMETCLKALPAILRGKQLATDVMFPNSSMELVEGIYRGNAMAEYFNEILGRTLVAGIEYLLSQDQERRIRILEIGAGTGGTTAKLLPMLSGLPVEEYCYTDVSKAFLMYAEKHYKPQFPAMTTAIFDVSKPLAEQSIAPGLYDFVIATNVLHATPDIRETLRNTKAALQNEGVLLVNDISEWSLFSHLTFGLLEGWWLPQDAAVRLSGSPGLSQQGWREVLTEEGYEHSLFPAERAHRLGQQIIAAGSNGWVRQRIAKKPQAQTPPAPAAAVMEATKTPAVRSNRTMKASSRSVVATEKMRIDHVQQVIVDNLSESLRMDPSMIRSDYPFADYGVDSIIGVNLVRTISETLQIELETTSLFEYSTVDQLARYIVGGWPEEIKSILGQSGNDPAATVAFEDLDSDSAAAEGAYAEAAEFVAANRFGGFRQAAGDHEDMSPVADAKHPDNRVGPIAIIGMSGRFAESESLAEFWDNLKHGRNLVKKVTRWDPANCVIEDAGQDYCSYGSFIDVIDEFDPAFFGISGVEATYMDPQQRLFLEESWRALEDAGYVGKSANEKQCGVYVGCGSSNYDTLFSGNPPPQAFWGNSSSVIPARIAYCLNLQGPALAIDTACSSSLVAIHLACQGLWAGETEMALAGGVFLQVTPGFYQVANRAGMLSPDGKCYSFDARANGFVPGEGVGVVVLKRLNDAINDGDHIHGVIAASGINQDGSSNGLIAPNARAQERLERSVYERFQIDPSTIQVLEAHGTGTLLGDSIEYSAISRSFREYTDKKNFCAIGTVKTNIGHAATAAGVAGVLKLLLSIRHRQLPPSLHFENRNPAVDIDAGPFYVNTELKDWQVDAGQVRRAAISSFGFSGTNAHLIIEEAPAMARAPVELPGYLIAVSARTSEQLRAQVANLLSMVEADPDVSMSDLCYSLFVSRVQLASRFSCVAKNRAELIRVLVQWLDTGIANQAYSADAREGNVREQVTLKKFGNYCIQECASAVDSETYFENLAAIADLYVQGYSLDYEDLFPRNSRRIPLPLYPFARERYWVDAADKRSVAPGTMSDARLHPLIHSNTSNLIEQSFSAVFTGDEPFIKGHRSNAGGHGMRGVLPDMACLEMVRVALGMAMPAAGDAVGFEFRDTKWAQPVEIHGATALKVALIPRDDEGIDYELYATGSGRNVVHCQGFARYGHAPKQAPVNVGDLLRNMRRGTLDIDALYADLTTSGIQYGADYRAIDNIRLGDGELLAWLSLRADDDADATDHGLRPALMVNVLNACRALVNQSGKTVDAAKSIFSLESVSIHASCGNEMAAWVRFASTGSSDAHRVALDVDIVDAQGQVCVQMRNLVLDLKAASGVSSNRSVWSFSKPGSVDGAGDGNVSVAMNAVEKIELFLRQEAASLLKKPIADVPLTLSYFDLGLASLEIANLVKKTNDLLGEELAPSALFEYKDIQSLSGYLSETHREKVDAIVVSKRVADQAQAEQQRPEIEALPRRRMSVVDVPHSMAAPPPVVAIPRPAISEEDVMSDIVWHEISHDDSFDKITF